VRLCLDDVGGSQGPSSLLSRIRRGCLHLSSSAGVYSTSPQRGDGTSPEADLLQRGAAASPAAGSSPRRRVSSLFVSRHRRPPLQLRRPCGLLSSSVVHLPRPLAACLHRLVWWTAGICRGLYGVYAERRFQQKSLQRLSPLRGTPPFAEGLLSLPDGLWAYSLRRSLLSARAALLHLRRGPTAGHFIKTTKPHAIHFYGVSLGSFGEVCLVCLV
jgi:hypothetical protein